jgi:hypothetical protein
MPKNSTTWKDSLILALSNKEGISLQEYSTSCFTADKFYIWVGENTIFFGAKESFDRWANSTDFIMYYPDRNFKDEDADAIVAYIDYLISNGGFNKKWGSNIVFSIRDARKFYKKLMFVNRENELQNE